MVGQNEGKHPPVAQFGLQRSLCMTKGGGAQPKIRFRYVLRSPRHYEVPFVSKGFLSRIPLRTSDVGTSVDVNFTSSTSRVDVNFTSSTSRVDVYFTSSTSRVDVFLR